jgi:hypothetical protein
MKKKKLLKVIVLSESGENTIKVSRNYVHQNSLYKVGIPKVSIFMVDISPEDLKLLKEKNCIAEKKEIYVDLNIAKISAKKIARFAGFVL